MATIVETSCKCDVCGHSSRAVTGDKMNYSGLWRHIVTLGWNKVRIGKRVMDLCPSCYSRHQRSEENKRDAQREALRKKQR